ncbi:hypothetical protein ACNARK_17000 [Proteus sp. DFP240708]|uniref:hypothetical protein n=1 Tax=Proteus sp. DFP240708 TaxID=3399624 RepID=UPI003A4E2210
MFDKGDCAIDPNTKKVFFRESLLREDLDLKEFDGKKIEGFINEINCSNFSESWRQFERNKIE